MHLTLADLFKTKENHFGQIPLPIVEKDPGNNRDSKELLETLGLNIIQKDEKGEFYLVEIPESEWSMVRIDNQTNEIIKYTHRETGNIFTVQRNPFHGVPGNQNSLQYYLLSIRVATVDPRTLKRGSEHDLRT